MRPQKESIVRTLAWLWRHVAAAVALLLIVLALWLGWVIGRRMARPAQPERPASSEAADPTDARPTMYTCSMHPNVRLPDPDAKCPICFMDLIPVSSGDETPGSERRIALSEEAVKRSEIETARVTRFFPRARVRLFGKVTYDETSVARLTAYFPGRLDRLYVNYVGVPVAEGDHLAEIYSPQLLATFEELRQASAAVTDLEGMSPRMSESTRKTLAAARDKLRLYGLTPEQIRAVEQGELEEDRFTIYAPIGGVVTHLAAREGDYLETGEPIATVADLGRLWLDLEAYESQLPLLRWGQSVRFTVEAHPGETFTGRVAFIEPMVNERTRTVAVRVAVENEEGWLKPGMFASAVVEPRVAADGAVLSDELAGRWVGPMHPTIVKDGPGQCDVCGMELVPAESLGVVGDPDAVQAPLVIPRSAVLFTGTRSVVYVQVPDTERPTFEVRQVVLGPRADQFHTVRSGLQEGEQVAARGAFRIDSAMQIAGKPSMMMPGGGGGGGHGHGAHGTGAAPPQTGFAPESPVPDHFIHSLKPVFAAYLDGQEALAGDDLEAYLEALRDLQSALGFVDEAGLLGEQLGSWRRIVGRLRTDARPATLTGARAGFERLSGAIIELERTFGHRGEVTWHVAYCPMASDNEGAEWLQRGEQIANPYFGASMLRCGELRAAAPPRTPSGVLLREPQQVREDAGDDQDAGHEEDGQHEGHPTTREDR